MKKILFSLMALLFVSFLFTSCQKAKETEGKKEGQVQRQEIQQQPSETKIEVQPKQEELPIKPEVKEEKKEKPIETKLSPLTEEEQSEFDKLKEKWHGPKFTKEDALKALQVFIKADLNYLYIRWYDTHPDEEPGDDICDLLRILGGSTKKEAFVVTLEVLKKDTGYPTVCAVSEIKRFKNKEAIPYLRKYLNYIASNEQITGKLKLEAAGSLLALGDADTALPVLDELAKEGSTYAIPYLFKSGWGKEWKLWDARGLEIIRRALNYPIDQIKAEAALFLVEMGMEKEKAEGVALGIVDRFKDKTKKDYGLKIDKAVTRSTPEGERFHNDGVACDYAMKALGILKSKKAVLAIKQISERNTDSRHVCWKRPADEALKNILGED